jgi:hypothetical protein
LTLGLSTHVELRKTKEESVHEGKLDRLATPNKEALAAYRHALAVDPTEPRIYGRRADTYRALGETESQRYMFAFQAPCLGNYRSKRQKTRDNFFFASFSFATCMGALATIA